ncbi:uncharacterized protein LOC123216525 [Mangifera indica]|uniref:uncharacterized protein LOC123216525 n=1 Tax=Mangifera indica TaxID=29780 RepID=UPI001CFBCC80|nr:uncharacterized protein LOC123216525 [Mangifera indica]
MRTKTRVSRARLCKLPAPTPTPTTNDCSLHFPTLNLDEANDNENVVNATSASADIGTDNLVGMRGGLGVSGEFTEMDWSEGESCIICDKSGENLLVCSEIGCSLSLHENCMNSRPKFDDVGNFYCPYCWYKCEKVRTRELRKKAMEAKRALSCFIDLKIDGDNEEKKNCGREKGEELNVSPRGGQKMDFEDGKDDDQIESLFVEVDNDRENDGDTAKLADSCDQCKIAVEHQSEFFSDDQSLKEKPVAKSPLNTMNKEQSSEENVSESHECEVLEVEEEIQVEDSEQADDSENERTETDPCIASSVQEGIAVDGPHQVEGREMGISDSVKQKQGRRGDEVKILPETSGAEMSDSDAETVLMCQRRVGQKGKKKAPQNIDSPRKRSSPLNARPKKIARTHNEKVKSSKKPNQQKAAAKKFSNQMYCNERRKRLHWTAAEEEMLKEGVQKFSTKVNKNLPWRKILEFGHHVFDPSRNPADLKDKWRNIMAKECSMVNRS